MGNTDVPGEFEQTQVRIKLSGDSCQMVHTDSDHAPVSVRTPSVATTGRKSATKTWKSVFPKQLRNNPPAHKYLFIAILGTIQVQCLTCLQALNLSPM